MSHEDELAYWQALAEEGNGAEGEAKQARERQEQEIEQERTDPPPF